MTAKDNIPYPRQEFTSTGITASFIVHLSTLKGYCLDEPKRRFLQSWALYKIDRFLNDYLRLRTACEFEVVGILATLDGKPADLGSGDGKWPETGDIKSTFTTARETCFPKLTEGDEWAQRRVSEVTYAMDVVGQQELPEGVTAEDFDLDHFAERAAVKPVTTGKGTKKKTFVALLLTGEWPEEDQNALIGQNLEKRETDGGEEQDNPAHDVVKKALKKWNDNWKKDQKKMSGTEETEVPE